MTTGKNPTIFLDAEAKKPHQRTSLNQKLSVLDESILTKINRIFDRSFEIKIDSRWQSIPALKNALCDLLETSPDKSKDYLTRIKNQLSGSSKYEECKLFQNLAQQIIEEIYDISQDIVIELGSDFHLIHEPLSGWSCPSVDIDWEVLTFSQKVFCISYNFSNQLFHPEFKGYITGNEVVLVSDLKGKEIELLRTPLSGEPDFTGFSKRLTEFYHEGVYSII